MRGLTLNLLILYSLIAINEAVDRAKFRTCTQTSFCRRHRFHKPKVTYNVDENSIRYLPCNDGGDENAENDNNEEEDAEEKSGLWNKIISSASRFTKNPEEQPSTKDVLCNKKSSYYIGPKPIFYAELVPTSTYKLNNNNNKALTLTIHVHSNGIFRIRVTDPSDHRYVVDSLVLNKEEMKEMDSKNIAYYENVEDLASLLLPIPNMNDNKKYRGFQVQVGGESYRLVMQLSPFEMFYFQENDLLMQVNSDQLMYFENLRSKDSEGEQQDQRILEHEGDKSPVDDDSNELKEEEAKQDKEIVGYWEDGLAIYADGTREERHEATEEEVEEEERHRQLEVQEEAEDTDGLFEEHFHSHVDTKPHGPTSIGLDVSFTDAGFLYGIPEHASSFILKSTIGDNSHYNEPYRLYNADVFEYELDETMALYGHIPFIVGHGTKATSGAFFFNPTETFVDIHNKEGNKQNTHWMSESGIIDLFLFSSASTTNFYSKYASLTGRLYLPPMFSLGYHQCRWNYKDEKDVYFVHSQFEKYDYPYDVLWLDIEHTDGKRYFTWDSALFPNPTKMQETLGEQGRKMVTIIDPHIKRDDNYYIHKIATKNGYYIRDKDNAADYDGWCWPGSSSYLDFTSKKVRAWFASQFAYNTYQHSTKYLHTWNDMNEPSVFNGPEVSMSKDLLNLDGVEHRQWHNIYGMLFHRSSLEGLIQRNEGQNERGFVLSRSFFAGSQRYGAIWTGDNTATWDHLAISSPMLLSLSIAGLSFVGADVGGFFGNPTEELQIRWNQVGAYQPFFRGHAHHDSKRREPWVWGEKTLSILRSVTMERYALLPYWYTIFWQGVTTGLPVMRPLWIEYPKEESLYPTDDQYMIGSSLLVKPITEVNQVQGNVLFPREDYWYDVRSLERINLNYSIGGVEEKVVDAPLHIIPVFQRGGTIIPRKLRLRRSTETMKYDPYTLHVAINKDGNASGQIYFDDETTFDYKKHQNYATSTLKYSKNNLMNMPEVGSGWQPTPTKRRYDTYMKVERIVIMGLDEAVKDVKVFGKSHDFEFENGVCVIRKPDVELDRKFIVELIM